MPGERETTDGMWGKENGCPGPALLEVFACGGSGDAVLDKELSNHVKACEQCAQTLHDVRHNNDFLTEYKHELEPHGQLFEGSSQSLAVPGYQLVAELHRGAQGIVYRAVQESTKRTVAIKVMLQGAFATSRQRARFEREAEVAAQLVHPNIVTVYDTLATGAGRFAIVMEYVQGQTLDDWCREQRGSGNNNITHLLDVFMPVVAAVHYAHQRGVIHRDIKPANIVVDAQGRPRVLDFGIAKLTSGSDGAINDVRYSAMTRAGEFAGTLAYAAPEQLRGDNSQIDVRTDVYTLGAVLYEMLTGSMPYDISGGVATIIDRVLHQEPARAMKINPALDDDLSTIVARALSKEPLRRYQSAAEFYKDLERYRAGEAIDAKRDSTFYIVSKWASRRRPLVIAGTVACIAALGGAAMGVYALAERKSRETVEIAREQEARSRAAADEAKDALGRILTSISPGAARGRPVSVTYMLDSAEQELAKMEATGTSAIVEADLRSTVGQTYTQLGDLHRAKRHLERAVSLYQQAGQNESLMMAEALDALGRVMGVSGELDEGVATVKRALSLRRRLAGELSTDVASSLRTLGGIYVHNARFDEAQLPLTQSLTISSGVFGGAAPELIETKALLAQALWQGGQPDYSRAEALFRESLAQYRAGSAADHPAIADGMYQLAHMLTAAGSYVEARQLAKECAQMRERLFGNEHSTLANALDLEAGLLAIDGDQRGASKLLERSLIIYRGSLARATLAESQSATPTAEATSQRTDISRQLATAAANLGRVYYTLGNYEAAVPVLKEWHANVSELLAQNANVTALGSVGAATLADEVAVARDCLRQVYTDLDNPAEAAKWAGDGE